MERPHEEGAVGLAVRDAWLLISGLAFEEGTEQPASGQPAPWESSAFHLVGLSTHRGGEGWAGAACPGEDSPVLGRPACPAPGSLSFAFWAKPRSWE